MSKINNNPYVADIRTREKNLRNRLVELGKEVVPEGNKLPLSYCCECLFPAETLSAFLQTHVTETNSNGT